MEPPRFRDSLIAKAFHNGRRAALHGVSIRAWSRVMTDDGSAPLVSPCEDLGLSGYWFIRSASVSSLSIEARSEGDIRLASANLSLSQTFTFSYENGYYHIIYAETGLALETAPGIASSPSDVSLGAAVSQSKRQQWSAVRTESGALRFCNLATGYWLRRGCVSRSENRWASVPFAA